jgi:hypothetical protein
MPDDEEDSDEDEDIVESKWENKDTEELCSEYDKYEEVQDRMNYFYLGKDKTTKSGTETPTKNILTCSWNTTAHLQASKGK